MQAEMIGRRSGARPRPSFDEASVGESRNPGGSAQQRIVHAQVVEEMLPPLDQAGAHVEPIEMDRRLDEDQNPPGANSSRRRRNAALRSVVACTALADTIMSKLAGG